MKSPKSVFVRSIFDILRAKTCIRIKHAEAYLKKNNPIKLQHLGTCITPTTSAFIKVYADLFTLSPQKLKIHFPQGYVSIYTGSYDKDEFLFYLDQEILLRLT